MLTPFEETFRDRFMDLHLRFYIAFGYTDFASLNLDPPNREMAERWERRFNELLVEGVMKR